MRIAAATLTAVLTLLAGALLSGAGHGWNAGALGCLALAPVAFVSCTNALGPKPSVRAAVIVLSVGLLICLLVSLRTLSDGPAHFSQYFAVNGILGVSVATFAVLGWLAPSLAVLFCAHPRARLGT